MRYSARVIPGRGEGRGLGFPTINMELPDAFNAEYGIYAGWVWMSGEKMPAAIHYGPVPVFGVEKVSLEAHVIDMHIPDVPGEIELELVKHLRDIGQIANIEALKEQIAKDVAAAREVLKIV